MVLNERARPLQYARASTHLHKITACYASLPHRLSRQFLCISPRGRLFSTVLLSRVFSAYYLCECVFHIGQIVSLFASLYSHCRLLSLSRSLSRTARRRRMRRLKRVVGRMVKRPRASPTDQSSSSSRVCIFPMTAATSPLTLPMPFLRISQCCRAGCPAKFVRGKPLCILLRH